MALAALLLDLDGTLVDSNAAHTEAMVRAAADLGVTVPADRVDMGIGKGADLLAPDLFGPAFEAEHGDAFRDGAGQHFARIAAHQPLQTFDGTLALIDAARARGLRLALASSAAEDDLDATFASTGTDLRERVDIVTTSSDAEASKPEPDLLLIAAEKLGVPPVACALVGDTVFDAEAARRAGVAFIGVATWRASEDDLRAAGACATFASTAALADSLDAALAAASPGEHAVTDDVLTVLMDVALTEARAALDAGDAPIGTVVARADGTVLARGRNRSATDHGRLRHAETEALHALGGAAEPGAVLLTTLEPCAMCLGAAVEAGVHAVVYALEAPPNGAAGRLLPARTGGPLPLVARGPGREASLALVREAAAAGGYAERLLASLGG
ncbi:MAG TPA: HAD-IA family hydrolase [Rubricoccaceae bacterium]|jgi:HAD superfamily hydrolase (TIGR01509 family)